MMNERQWNSAKSDYEAVPIPPELNDRVCQGIREGRAARRRGRRLRQWGACAAGFVLIFACLNLSPAIAHAAADLPVVGGLFEVLTIRNYVDTDGDRRCPLLSRDFPVQSLSNRSTTKFKPG